jgi:hypothetical protein
MFNNVHRDNIYTNIYVFILILITVIVVMLMRGMRMVFVQNMEAR